MCNDVTGLVQKKLSHISEFHIVQCTCSKVTHCGKCIEGVPLFSTVELEESILFCLKAIQPINLITKSKILFVHGKYFKENIRVRKRNSEDKPLTKEHFVQMGLGSNKIRLPSPAFLFSFSRCVVNCVAFSTIRFTFDPRCK